MKSINVQELKELLDKKADIQLIDVREPNEHEAGNIGGTLIPLSTVPDSHAQIDKEKKVVIYCQKGGRSARAIEFLEQNMGFNNLINLEGGYSDWAEQIINDTTEF